MIQTGTRDFAIGNRVRIVRGLHHEAGLLFVGLIGTICDLDARDLLSCQIRLDGNAVAVMWRPWWFDRSEFELLDIITQLSALNL